MDGAVTKPQPRRMTRRKKRLVADGETPILPGVQGEQIQLQTRKQTPQLKTRTRAEAEAGVEAVVGVTEAQ